MCKIGKHSDQNIEPLNKIGLSYLEISLVQQETSCFARDKYKQAGDFLARLSVATRKSILKAGDHSSQEISDSQKEISRG